VFLFVTTSSSSWPSSAYGTCIPVAGLEQFAYPLRGFDPDGVGVVDGLLSNFLALGADLHRAGDVHDLPVRLDGFRSGEGEAGSGPTTPPSLAHGAQARRTTVATIG
jgi:hypothetical protein